MRHLWRAIWAATAAITLGLPAVSLANPNDISIRGLGRPPPRATLKDPAVKRYKWLSNELTIALMPKPLAPAETLGMDGFEFSVVTTHTDNKQQEPYWQGQPGSPVFEGDTRNRKTPSDFWTPTAHLRKGLPLSSEIGISGSYLSFSEMFMLGTEFKIAWHEAFFRYAPALATRVAFARLFGSSDLDIIAGEADVLVSLPFGVGGMAQLTPFLGYGQIFIHINSQVIDETPYAVRDGSIDQRGGPTGSLYNFPTIDWNDNMQQRFFVGMRLIAAFIELTYEFDFVMVDGPHDMISHAVKLGFDV